MCTNIPYSLALRIVRICSENETRDLRLSELRNMLLERDYKAKIIDAAIEKARKIPRSEALKRVEKQKSNERPVFVVRFDPRLPDINGIIKKHWRSTTHNHPHMATIFPKAPLIAYKRPMNIRDKLIRAKVPPKTSNRPKRIKAGMKKCNKPCSICPYVNEQKFIKSSATNVTKELSKQHTCKDRNIVYIINCKKCKQQYIGETDRTLKDRMLEHLGYVRREETSQATGFHFNQPGHQMSDMSISVFERINSYDPQYRKTRESYWIGQFDLLRQGINRKR